MFRIVFMVTCALPLAFFTSKVVKEQVTGTTGDVDQQAGPDEKDNGGGETATAAEILKRAKADSEMMEVLADFDPLNADGTSNQPNLTNVSPSERFVTTKNQIEKLKPARHAIQAFMDRFPMDADEEPKELQKYLEETPLSELAGAKQFSKSINERIKLLKDQGRCKELFAKAEKAWKAEQYAECIEVISEIPLDIADEETQKKVGVLMNEAKFAKHWKQHRRQPGNPQAEADLLKRLFKNMPDPPNDAASRKVAQLKKRLESLDGKITVQKLFQEDDADVAEFAKAAAETAKAYPEEAGAISVRFSKWLKRQIKPKSVPPRVKDFGEAETPNGDIISGIFIEIKGNGKVTAFKYWKTAADRRARVGFDTKYFPGELATKPGPPADVSLLEKYQKAFELLQNDKKLSNQTHWKAFAEFCERSHKEMLQYAEKKGQNKPTVTFEVEAKQARAILDAWDDISFILSKRSTGGPKF